MKQQLITPRLKALDAWWALRYGGRMKHKKTPFQLDLRQLAKDLRANLFLIYPVTTLTGGDGRRRSTVQREMTKLGLGEYDIERDAWVLDRSKVLEHLAADYASECGTETVKHLAVVQVHQRAFREQVLSHFALQPEKTE
jgi:hypothetical protein